MNPTQIEHAASGVASVEGEIERLGQIEQPGGALAVAAPQIAPAPVPQPGRFLLCEQCQVPVDHDQRYCVRCGARQSHARNPATTYFATAARSRRTGAAPRQQPQRVLNGPLFALFLVVLPLAVSIGVLVGRSGPGGSNDKLIAALQKPIAVGAAGASTTSASTAASFGASSGNLPSDFSMPHGFAVKLSTLPVQGTDQSAVSRAEQQARGKGAGQVGLINPKDFKVTPGQGASNYVVYSGQFKTRAEAQRAIQKLKSRFSGAQVIAVAQVASASVPVVAHTAYGTVHQVAGSRPTAQQIQQDKKVVQKINRTVGKSYVNAQKGLPDVITVTGGPNGSNTSAAEKLGEG